MSAKATASSPMTCHLNATVHVWHIDNFMSRKEKKLTSDSFTIPGCPLIKWSVSCYPLGDQKESDGFVSIFLNKCTGDCEIELQYQLAIVGEIQEKEITRSICFNKERHNSGLTQFLARNQLVENRYLVNKTLTIQVKVFKIGRAVYLDHHLNHSLNWKPFDLTDIKNGDVRLKAKRKTFKAHKFMLARESPYFNAMFDGKFKEQVNNEVDLTQFRADVIQEVVRFIYTDQLQDLDYHSDKLIVAADYFQMDYLKNLCQDNMTYRISFNNCLEFLAIADQTNSASLKKVAMRFIHKNKNHIDKRQMKSFFKDHLDLAIEWLYWNDF